MIHDIHPKTPIASLQRDFTDEQLEKHFPLSLASALTGMQPSFIKKALESKGDVSLKQVLFLLDLDSFAETFIPRSMIPQYLINHADRSGEPQITIPAEAQEFHQGSSTDLIPRLPKAS